MVNIISNNDDTFVLNWIRNIKSDITFAYLNIPWITKTQNMIFPPLEENMRIKLINEIGINKINGIDVFYRYCDGVSLPDICNGYFIHGLKLIAHGIQNDQPLWISDPWNCPIVVIGSVGDGGLFAIDKNRFGKVFFLPESRIVNQIYEARSVVVKILAYSYYDFLSKFEKDMKAYVHRTPDWQYMV